MRIVLGRPQIRKNVGRYHINIKFLCEPTHKIVVRIEIAALLKWPS